MYKKVRVVKDAISVGSEYEESDSNLEQWSAVDGARDNNDDFIPDVDKVESDTDIGQVVNRAQFEEKTSGKYFK